MPGLRRKIGRINFEDNENDSQQEELSDVERVQAPEQAEQRADRPQKAQVEQAPTAEDDISKWTALAKAMNVITGKAEQEQGEQKGFDLKKFAEKFKRGELSDDELRTSLEQSNDPDVLKALEKDPGFIEKLKRTATDSAKQAELMNKIAAKGAKAKEYALKEIGGPAGMLIGQIEKNPQAAIGCAIAGVLGLMMLAKRDKGIGQWVGGLALSGISTYFGLEMFGKTEAAKKFFAEKFNEVILDPQGKGKAASQALKTAFEKGANQIFGEDNVKEALAFLAPFVKDIPGMDWLRKMKEGKEGKGGQGPEQGQEGAQTEAGDDGEDGNGEGGDEGSAEAATNSEGEGLGEDAGGEEEAAGPDQSPEQSTGEGENSSGQETEDGGEEGEDTERQGNEGEKRDIWEAMTDKAKQDFYQGLSPESRFEMDAFLKDEGSVDEFIKSLINNDSMPLVKKGGKLMLIGLVAGVTAKVSLEKVVWYRYYQNLKRIGGKKGMLADKNRVGSMIFEYMKTVPGTSLIFATRGAANAFIRKFTIGKALVKKGGTSIIWEGTKGLGKGMVWPGPLLKDIWDLRVTIKKAKGFVVDRKLTRKFRGTLKESLKKAFVRGGKKAAEKSARKINMKKVVERFFKAKAKGKVAGKMAAKGLGKATPRFFRGALKTVGSKALGAFSFAMDYIWPDSTVSSDEERLHHAKYELERKLNALDLEDEKLSGDWSLLSPEEKEKVIQIIEEVNHSAKNFLRPDDVKEEDMKDVLEIPPELLSEHDESE